MININFKKILSWQNAVLAVLYLLSVVSFYNLESNISFKILVSLVSVIAFFLLFWKKNLEFLVTIVYYLAVYDFYNLFLALHWPLYVVMLMLIVCNLIILFLFVVKEVDNLKNDLLKLYLALFNLVSVELFLSLLPWPINPIEKAMLLMVMFYALASMIRLKINNKFQKKKTIPLLVVFIVMVFTILITSKWYGY